MSRTGTSELNAPPSTPLSERLADQPIAYRRVGRIDLSQLIFEARELAERLPQHAYVINMHTDRYAYLLGFCAAVIAGQCTLMPPNRQPDTLADLQSSYPDSYFLEPNTYPLLESIPYRASGTQHDGNDIPRVMNHQSCVIAFTSGSTGRPTPILKTWETLRGGILSDREALIGDRDKPLSMLATVPSQHMWGFGTSVLLPLFAQVAISELNPFYPKDISEALSSLPEPRVLVSSPLHLRALMKSRVALPKLECIFTATAPLTAADAVLMEAHFQAPILDVFGCSESGIFATRRTASEDLWTLTRPFELETRESGTFIRAPHLPAPVSLPDIVEQFGERQFRWLGRQQDMVNVAGKRGSLADLNRRLLAIPGVEDGVIFKPENAGERLAALVVAPALSVSEIQRELRARMEPVFVPRPLLLVTDLPRQETGKLPLAAVQALFAELRAKRDCHSTGIET